MTPTKRRRLQILHLVVDFCEIAGGGLIADFLFRMFERMGSFASKHSWMLGLVGAVIISAGLFLDRHNALTEENQSNT
jgi:hypothetical protein